MAFQKGQPKPAAGGRKKGVPNKASVARAQAIAASGLTPLDYMLSVLRNTKAAPADRMEAAKSAAPYVHQKLATIAHTGPNGGPVEYRDLSKLTDDELARLDDLRARLVLAGSGTGDPDGNGEEGG